MAATAFTGDLPPEPPDPPPDPPSILDQLSSFLSPIHPPFPPKLLLRSSPDLDMRSAPTSLSIFLSPDLAAFLQSLTFVLLVLTVVRQSPSSPFRFRDPKVTALPHLHKDPSLLRLPSSFNIASAIAAPHLVALTVCSGAVVSLSQSPTVNWRVLIMGLAYESSSWAWVGYLLVDSGYKWAWILLGCMGFAYNFNFPTSTFTTLREVFGSFDLDVEYSGYFIVTSYVFWLRLPVVYRFLACLSGHVSSFMESSSLVESSSSMENLLLGCRFTTSIWTRIDFSFMEIVVPAPVAALSLGFSSRNVFFIPHGIIPLLRTYVAEILDLLVNICCLGIMIASILGFHVFRLVLTNVELSAFMALSSMFVIDPFFNGK